LSFFIKELILKHAYILRTLKVFVAYNYRSINTRMLILFSKKLFVSFKKVDKKLF